MSTIMRVFLLLAVLVCISEAQFRESRQQCLCQRFRRPTNNIKDLQIYKATIFCDKVEIVVTTNSGLRYCLNPGLKVVKGLLNDIMGKQRTSTARPSEFSSTQGSTTARK